MHRLARADFPNRKQIVHEILHPEDRPAPQSSYSHYSGINYSALEVAVRRIQQDFDFLMRYLPKLPDDSYAKTETLKILKQHKAYMAQFDNETVNAIMNEALKYQGWEYVYGGASPTTSFDCSGLTQWCYGVAGITLPRTAQAQYDVTRHIPFGDAQPGDLVFFQGTYNCGDYITHVGIYVGDNRMYHAGNPIGFADLTSAYWQAHLVCAGRNKCEIRCKINQR